MYIEPYCLKRGLNNSTRSRILDYLCRILICVIYDQNYFLIIEIYSQAILHFLLGSLQNYET